MFKQIVRGLKANNHLIGFLGQGLAIALHNSKKAKILQESSPQKRYKQKRNMVYVIKKIGMTISKWTHTNR